MSQLSKSIERENKLVIAWAWEVGEKWVVTANGYRTSFWNNENDLKLIVVMIAQVCEYSKNY